MSKDAGADANAVGNEVQDLIGMVTEAIVGEGKGSKEDVKDAQKEENKSDEQKAQDFEPDTKDKDKKPEQEEEKEEAEEEAEVEEEDKKEEKKPEKDERDEIIEQLRAQIIELSSNKEPEQQAGEEKAEGKKSELVPGEFFENDEEYDKVFDKKEAMNKVLTRVYQSAVEGVLRTIPQVINNLVQTQIDVYTKTSDFYKKNEDLQKMKQFVGVVANDLAGKHPDWSLEKLFDELGGDGKDNIGEVRKRLGIKVSQEKKEVTNDRKRKPPFPSRGSGARPTEEKQPNLTPLEKEIGSLIDL